MFGSLIFTKHFIHALYFSNYMKKYFYISFFIYCVIQSFFLRIYIFENLF